jgi:hypothetical protein
MHTGLANEDLMQQLRESPLLIRILAVAAAAIVIVALAAGMGVMAALVLGPGPNSSPGEPEKIGGVEHRREAGTSEGDQPRQAGKDEGAPDRLSEGEYVSVVGTIQNGSVEASLDSNDKLVHYDSLTAADVEKLEANHAMLEDSSERVEELDPPEGYEDQDEVFVLAINELRGANELAHRFAADPTSATQAGFEAYDNHIDRATTYLQRSNEMLGRNYKTTETARDQPRLASLRPCRI